MTTLHAVDEDLSRAAVIARIKRGLESRSGKRWSVTGGTGTAYGWLHIDAPPARRTWRDRPRPGATGLGTYAEDWDPTTPASPEAVAAPPTRPSWPRSSALTALTGT